MLATFPLRIGAFGRIIRRKLKYTVRHRESTYHFILHFYQITSSIGLLTHGPPLSVMKVALLYRDMMKTS